MRRDPSIPLFLWIATAALVHILWGGGAEKTVAFFEDRNGLSRLAESVRMHVQRTNQRVEISLIDESLPPTEEDRPNPDGEVLEPEDNSPPKPEKADKEELKPPRVDKQKTDLLAKDAEHKPEAEPEKPKPKAEDKKPEAKADQQQLQLDRRVAVVQPDKAEKQAPNPNAEFLGQQDNHVEQQTQARITSRDQNDPEPTPGMAHASADQEPGDSTQHEIANLEDSAGDPNKAPNDPAHDGKPTDTRSPAAPQAPAEIKRLAFGQAAPANAQQAPNNRPEPPASKGHQAQAQRQAVDAFPNAIQTESGAFSIAPEQEARTAQAGRQAQAHRDRPKARRKMPDVRGFGSLGTTPGGLNPNLTPLSALDAIGGEQLKQERLADGQRRRSKHRGSWNAVGLERWRSAIENYVASVTPGNQTALNTAAAPFATFINRIHQRIHGLFADTFLVSLDALPADHPMNRRDLRTNLEIVLSHEDGRVVRMGITRPSGSTMFDVSALESVQRASPFGASPPEIVSPDGNVYLHWEFYREPDMACSTYFARPFLLRVKPKSAPMPPAPLPIVPKNEPEEHGSTSPSPNQVHG
jgi:TonB family protein